MKNTKALNTITTCGIGMHFFCCGIPLIATLFGSSVSFFSFIPEYIMRYILIFSGFMLVLSWVFYLKNKCDCSKWQFPFLILITILFAFTIFANCMGM